LMVADGVKHIVHTLIMLVIVRKQIGRMSGYSILTTTAKSIVAALLVGITAYYTAVFMAGAVDTATTAGKLLVVVISGGAGVLVYTALVFLLDLRDAKSLRGILPIRQNTP
ncbi:MAG: hypothetical protein ACK2UG_03105, partial [Candidatus Promineifilaceae bacterium]